MGENDASEVEPGWFVAYRKWHYETVNSSTFLPGPSDAFKAGAEWAKVSHETLQYRIERYLTAEADRDQLVKDLLAAGWKKRAVAIALKMGRPTINRILGAAYPYNHGREFITPAKKYKVEE